jgi:hypothetical protein
MRVVRARIYGISLALIAGLLLPRIWHDAYDTVGLWFHLDAAHYRGTDPYRDSVIFNLSIGVVVGVVASLLLGIMLYLRWFLLALILNTTALLFVLLTLAADGYPFWMLYGWTPYSFVMSICVGAWVGENIRQKVLSSNKRLERIAGRVFGVSHGGSR